ncbi:MAG TPA: ATP-dependent DNA helicase RecG [Gammaproteobacteria bacterium]|nr:ATP-dependent DNA helicase RecG [Gammaproteobacteria bacterium]
MIKKIPSVEQLSGVGTQTAKHLDRLGVSTIQDLLLHLPMRYQDRTQIQAIKGLTAGEEVVVEGVLTASTALPSGKTKWLCQLKDGTGTVYLRFFHILPFQIALLKPGVRLRCYGEVRWGAKGLEVMHPEFQVIAEDKPLPVDQHLTPIYPATKGLGQHTLRKLTEQALRWMTHEKEIELVPDAVLQALSFPTFHDAVRYIHRPPQGAPIVSLMENETTAQKRLVFEELLAHRISLLLLKKKFQTQLSFPLLREDVLIKKFMETLSFRLTGAQERVMREIRQDLSCDKPMLRLIQGDVGSGKTVIAALAMLQAVENGYQAAMMVPTELLAEQHHRVFKRWLDQLNLKVVFLSGNVKGKSREAALSAIASGEAQLVLGTHALFQEEVVFQKLALLVIDEQHRFGVQQRAFFREKGVYGGLCPHQLMMTATPIPRTLAMSFYADIDCSVIDELPPGRTPVLTSVIASTRRQEVIARVATACAAGRQVYWVCPLIEASDVIACQAVDEISVQLQESLPHIKIGVIHGRIAAAQKEAVMSAFQAGDIQLLVATTVIEVGVDVPNASVMVIENAERLGLSQLHQLRGRVGRGSIESFCLLLYQEPLSHYARERLQVMRETTDGFQIAQRDLELRGPGDVLGTRQTGELSFRIADLLRDGDLLNDVQLTAERLMNEYPEMIEPLLDRWLGEAKAYGKV